MDPRTPVIVGTGQVTHRTQPVPPPLELMTQAVRAAADDSGAPGLTGKTEVLACVDGFSWPVPDPGAFLRDALHLPGTTRTWRTTVGGNGPIALLGAVAQAIADGDLDVAVIAGGESFTPFKANGAQPPAAWGTQPDGAQPDRVIGKDRPPSHEAELAAGLLAPIFVYPLFEQALRHTAGRTPEEHQHHLGRLSARLAEVARTNPYAWTQAPPTDPAGLATPSPDNRLVSLPYTKVMNANIAVDQAAALIVTSAGAAAAAGVPKDRWVAVHATAQAHDHWFVCARDRLDRSPAIAATTGAALRHAQTDVDGLGHLDLYSCFPSAVQIAAQELGGYDPVTDVRPPTVTGGLGFAGGPANDYVTHALATMVDRLREDPGELGLATAVGWYLTKHGAAVLGAREPAAAFRDHDVQAEVDALPSREIATAGKGTVESATALFDRDGTATLGIVTTVREDGARVVAQTQDRAVAQALVDEDPLGRPVAVEGSTSFVLG